MRIKAIFYWWNCTCAFPLYKDPLINPLWMIMCFLETDAPEHAFKLNKLRLQDTFEGDVGRSAITWSVFNLFSSNFQELLMDKCKIESYHHNYGSLLTKSYILKNSKSQYTRAAIVVHLPVLSNPVKLSSLHWQMIVLKKCVRASCLREKWTNYRLLFVVHSLFYEGSEKTCSSS